MMAHRAQRKDWKSHEAKKMMKKTGKDWAERRVRRYAVPRDPATMTLQGYMTAFSIVGEVAILSRRAPTSMHVQYGAGRPPSNEDRPGDETRRRLVGYDGSGKLRESTTELHSPYRGLHPPPPIHLEPIRTEQRKYACLSVHSAICYD